ncbi:unnamed protein product [Acanthoscelides obtectus]|uniref:Uncharacterized protein n=1 Tax=Acanthoscelides obtectus TaxID=200917 RepID=A0A9P0VT28_ACAOB|nr:unnamed protein product [Acanthoscelides obtectus]CAK1659901.1 hypothetical protein AOBTE_LOCUS21739 [Acanthoscelides obtectus]
MGKEDFAIARERSHHAPHRRKRYGQSKVPGATLRYIQGISTKLLAKHDLWTIEYRPVQGHYEFAGIYTWDTGCKQEGQIAGFVRPDTDWIQTTLRKPIKELKRIEREYLRSH